MVEVWFLLFFRFKADQTILARGSDGSLLLSGVEGGGWELIGVMEFDLEDPLAGAGAEGWRHDEDASSESHRLESVESLFAAESDHVSSLKNPEDDLPLRRDAVSLLVQVRRLVIGECCDRRSGPCPPPFVVICYV